MHTNPYKAYQAAQKSQMSPREAEAYALLRAASELESVRGRLDDRESLDAALTRNRDLWLIFVDSATDPSSPLSDEARSNIANLGGFVFKRSLQILAEPTHEAFDVLININRNIAAGLSGR